MGREDAQYANWGDLRWGEQTGNFLDLLYLIRLLWCCKLFKFYSRQKANFIDQKLFLMNRSTLLANMFSLTSRRKKVSGGYGQSSFCELTESMICLVNPIATNRSLNRQPLLLALLLICLMTSFSGCVRRRLTVRTNPPGAMLYVDRQPIGMTPVSTRFTYYGTRHFEVIKDGYRTEKFLRRFNPPWYEWPGLAFVSETFWPFEQRDERIVDVQMSPDPVVPVEAVIASGQELRDQARLGVAVTAPPPATTIPTTTVPPVLPGSSPSDLVLPSPTVPSNGGDFVFPPQEDSGFSLPLPRRIPSAEPVPGGAYRPVQ